MKHNYRWTGRTLDPGALKILHEAQELNPDRTLGSLVSQAVWDWWGNLPDDDSAMGAGFEDTSNPDIEQGIGT